MESASVGNAMFAIPASIRILSDIREIFRTILENFEACFVTYAEPYQNNV